MIEWAIKGQLARSSRPGYSGSRTPVNRAVVDAWLDEVKSAGIKAIICLLAEEHLQLYQGLSPSRNLIEYYRTRGLEVAHVAVIDHQKPPLSEDDLQHIAAEYDRLPKPVLIHCSAGCDRTGAAVDYLLERHSKEA